MSVGAAHPIVPSDRSLAIIANRILERKRAQNMSRTSIALCCVLLILSVEGRAASMLPSPEEDLATLFAETCIRHLDNVAELSAIAAQRGVRIVINPDEANDEKRALQFAETWLIESAEQKMVLYFKQGTRDERRFALCLVRQDGDVFDASLSAITQSLSLRRLRAKQEGFARRASFLLDENGPVLIDLSAGQSASIQFTLISATKLLN